MNNFQSKFIVFFIIAGFYALQPEASIFVQRPEHGYIAHEWGTFTSLQDSEGHVTSGLTHEDTVLPDFVYGRMKLNPALNTQFDEIIGKFLNMKIPTAEILSRNDKSDCHNGKCLDFIPESSESLSVTQKMETPVIYFYSQHPEHVSVTVDFPEGIISQYYPSASHFFPPIGNVSALKNGQMTWEIDISTDSLMIPFAELNSSWDRSRQVDSNFISTQGENEKLIFYRGVGQFNTALQTRSNESGGLQIQNQSDQAIPSVFLLQVTSKGGKISSLGKILGNREKNIPHLLTDPSDLLPMAEYLEQATGKVAESLTASGLFTDEALAMVNTWKESYFTTPGIRVLYVLPRAWTNAILPLQMTPQPVEMVRTLVGRVEIMTQAEEISLMAKLKVAFITHTSATSDVEQLGRFAEPKLRRIYNLAKNDSVEFQDYIKELVFTARVN